MKVILLINLSLVFISAASLTSTSRCSIQTNTKVKDLQNNKNLTTNLFNLRLPIAREETQIAALSLFVPWLYFLSIAMNLSTLPKFINTCVNNGDSTVSPLSQKIYGDYSGLDSFFTFLSVNFIGCLSDSFGRKPFILFSSLGLGLSFLILSFSSSNPKLFYLSGCIDGLTSSMFGQAQAYATDRSLKRRSNEKNEDKSRESISEVIGRFQGLAIGLAYVVGVPLSSLLTRRGSYRTPIYAGVILCAVSSILTLLFLPESLQLSLDPTGSPVRPTINWSDANPVGAAHMLTSRGYRLGLGSLAYFFLHFAQTGTTVVWVNYLGQRFGWPQEYAGAAFLLMGLMVLIVPGFLITCFGKSSAVAAAIFLHLCALVVLGLARKSWVVALVGIPLLSVGASALPLTLGMLSELVSDKESGALQGAADTVRSLANMLANPVMSRVFTYFNPKVSTDSSVHYMGKWTGGSLLISAACSATALLLCSLIYKLQDTHIDPQQNACKEKNDLSNKKSTCT